MVMQKAVAETDDIQNHQTRSLRNDWSVSAVAAGFLAVLISYSGPAVIFFQAADVAHVSGDMIASWIWGISIGAGLSGILLSWALRVPVITAWSAPGTALLVTLFPAITLNQAVGAYITAAVIIFVIGVSGTFDRITRRIPAGIAAGMMAGILFQFGVNAFKSATTMPALTFGMVAAYVVFRRLVPRYCIVLVLLSGVILAMLLGDTNVGGFELHLTTPVFIAPEWTWGTTLSLALPLVLVSLTGQFLPGMAILHLSGYRTPARPIIAAASLASIGVAFFGGITIVVAAITAALCTGRDAHEDPAKRYVAGIANGVFDEELTERMLPMLERAADGRVRHSLRVGASEDFSVFAQQAPGLFVFLGITPEGQDPAKAAPNHNANFSVDESALVVGARTMASLAVNYLAAPSGK
jgi:benzoate membrane transport protein